MNSYVISLSQLSKQNFVMVHFCLKMLWNVCLNPIENSTMRFYLEKQLIISKVSGVKANEPTAYSTRVLAWSMEPVKTYPEINAPKYSLIGHKIIMLK